MTELPTIAPLKNVTLFLEMVERAIDLPDHLPRMALFYGPSGFGKTFSATYAANKKQAYYLEVGSFWSVGKFCDALIQETGAPLKRATLADKIDVIIERLALSDRPLIIDEFDHMMTDTKIELVRYIHDQSRSTIILIGEELLPTKLKRWERFHNRISQWVGAVQSDVADAAALARLYCPEIEIKEPVLNELVRVSGYRARRICTNLEQIRQLSMRTGQMSIDKANIDFNWFTGAAPVGRRF